MRFWPDPNRITFRGLARDTWRWLKVLRPFVLLGILASLYVGAGDPALIEPPGFLQATPEPVSADFTRCGPGRGAACVIDGDTFKLGEQATAKLQALLNERPFELVAPLYRDHDMYGRELRVVRRLLPDGSHESIAELMRKSGLARRYLGGFKTGWC
jgi:endonuclease YncB( thermonuclease family)